MDRATYQIAKKGEIPCEKCTYYNVPEPRSLGRCVFSSSNWKSPVVGKKMTCKTVKAKVMPDKHGWFNSKKHPPKGQFNHLVWVWVYGSGPGYRDKKPIAEVIENPKQYSHWQPYIEPKLPVEIIDQIKRAKEYDGPKEWYGG
jgi:hypothetical protein